MARKGPEDPTPRTYRFTPSTLEGISRLSGVIRPGVKLSDRETIEAIVYDRLEDEERKAKRKGGAR
jgi:hypothetical protein